MAVQADRYRLSVSLEELFPIRTFRFIVCNTLNPGYETTVVDRKYPVLFYIISGAIEIEAEGSTVRLETGEFCFLDMGTTQTYRNAASENTYMNVIGFSFGDPAVRIRDLQFPASGSLLSDPVASGLFHKLHNCWMEQKPGYRMKVLALLFDILSHISASCPEGAESPGEYHRLQDAVRYIYDNCFLREITVEDLSRHCNYSPAYLRKLFVHYFQMPPTKYIRHIKLELAKNMLVLSHKPISQVAREAGYKDIAHFDRVFKKETGVTPLEYRSMNFINHLTEI